IDQGAAHLALQLEGRASRRLPRIQRSNPSLRDLLGRLVLGEERNGNADTEIEALIPRIRIEERPVSGRRDASIEAAREADRRPSPCARCAALLLGGAELRGT